MLCQLADEPTEVTLVVHERDRKFTQGFDRVCEADGARVVLTSLMAPKANAHAERWVGSARRECLDWMLIVGQRHLSRVVGEYLTHYDTGPDAACWSRASRQSWPRRQPTPISRSEARVQEAVRGRVT